MTQIESHRGFITLFLMLSSFVIAAVGTLVGLQNFHPSLSQNRTSKSQHISHTAAVLPAQPQPEMPVTEAKIIDVPTSNTLVVKTLQATISVQLIGISPADATQEQNYLSCNNTPVLDEIKARLLYKTVYLIADDLVGNQSENTLLRYVFFQDGIFLNKQLIADGITQANIQDIYLYASEFLEAETQAENQKLGIWTENCEKNSRITPSPTLTPALTSTPTQKPSPSTVWYSASPTKPQPTPTKIPTPTSTPKPLSAQVIQKVLSENASLIQPPEKPTPTITPKPTLGLSSSEPITPPPSSLNADLLFVLINLHRKKLNLPAFQKDEQLCSLAASRRPELSNEIYVSGAMHKGLYDRNIPYWITENMASYPTEEIIFNWWLNSPVHRNAIEGNYKYSCGACYGTSCSQLFTNYTPK